ncbi:uncharacterized protein F5891DRAFT_1195358 [Suillus fuscotomentosus]|uniref:Uncharacterized protein n=1 Tax=Suillus fuscotomentosus TaxID=1912939 RepID=A0AAD4DXE5_9AGAM|nr:uncharacterized protein F5891DRAFT_1195358 [Suillus fuscotomentosus]KAG1894378.1 hypothetical protein F5891DRAFT_1195358 [Suillus fuscotomentosus]
MTTTTEFPIVELSDIARNMQNHTRLKEFIAFLVREGIIYFFFDSAEEGYAMADLFNNE